MDHYGIIISKSVEYQLHREKLSKSEKITLSLLDGNLPGNTDGAVTRNSVKRGIGGIFRKDRRMDSTIQS